MQRVEKFQPEVGKVYFIEDYCLIHILSGTGSIQVDFSNYDDWQQKVIFLEKGQYIKFLSDNFSVRRIVFSDREKFYNDEVRVLFKHLISLGYIDLMQCDDCQDFLSETALTKQAADIIDVSSKQWYWQNPFKASKEEYQVIFDAKDVVDREFTNNLTSQDLIQLINDNGYNAQLLVKDKIGLTIKHLVGAKRLKESQKQIAFTDKNVQEVAYDLGYKDDAYFNRAFKKSTGQTPRQFRENFDYAARDHFVDDILGLLKTHHTQERSLSFYADKMNLSIKALSNKTRLKLNVSLGQLIRNELVQTARTMLLADQSVVEVSLALGFEEPNHFSRFFKNYSGQTPTEFKNKKYNS